MSETSVDPDQLAHLYYLIWIYTGHGHVKRRIYMRESINQMILHEITIYKTNDHVCKEGKLSDSTL